MPARGILSSHSISGVAGCTSWCRALSPVGVKKSRLMLAWSLATGTMSWTQAVHTICNALAAAKTEGYLYLLSSPQHLLQTQPPCYPYCVLHQSSKTGTSGARSSACACSRNPSASHCSGCCRATCMPGMLLHGSKQYLLVEWL